MSPAFRIFRFLARITERLPFWMVYIGSFKLFISLYYISQYRRKVVTQNLQRAFPEFDRERIRKTRRHFYRHLCDVIFEIIKTPGMKPEDLQCRYHFRNPEIIHQLMSQERSAIIATGHFGNWEWSGPGLLLNFPGLEGYVVVKPLSDKYFEEYLNNIRRLYKSDVVIPFKMTLRYMLKHQNRTTYTLFAADQTPHLGDINFMAQFLNQPTPFYTGIEKLAKSLNQPVVYMEMYRLRRGYYEASFELISDKPADTADFEITTKYIRLLEQSIRRRPENWLWSHKRWKYARAATEKLQSR